MVQQKSRFSVSYILLHSVWLARAELSDRHSTHPRNSLSTTLWVDSSMNAARKRKSSVPKLYCKLETPTVTAITLQNRSSYWCFINSLVLGGSFSLVTIVHIFSSEYSSSMILLSLTSSIILFYVFVPKQYSRLIFLIDVPYRGIFVQFLLFEFLRRRLS